MKGLVLVPALALLQITPPKIIIKAHGTSRWEMEAQRTDTDWFDLHHMRKSDCL